MSTILQDDRIARENTYQNAIRLLNDDLFPEALSAFISVGAFKDANKHARSLLDSYARLISAGDSHTVAVQLDGTVLISGKIPLYRSARPTGTVVLHPGSLDISKWRDIIAVSASAHDTVGLKTDGTVVLYGSAYEYYPSISKWRNIVEIDCSDHTAIGLKSDGTVVAVGLNGFGQCNVHNASLWRNIIAISSSDHTVCLKQDGTVLATGRDLEGQCNVSEWRDIVSIKAGDLSTVGLRSDGTVLAVGLNKYGQCNVSQWRDVVSISASMFFTIGLKSDGTLLYAGEEEFNFPSFNPMFHWKDIVAISCGSGHVVGLKADGTVVSVSIDGADEFCRVDQWRDIILTSPENRKKLMESRKKQDQRIWESQGLCRNCGGKLSLFSKVCKSCNTKN